MALFFGLRFFFLLTLMGFILCNISEKANNPITGSPAPTISTQQDQSSNNKGSPAPTISTQQDQSTNNKAQTTADSPPLTISTTPSHTNKTKATGTSHTTHTVNTSTVSPAIMTTTAADPYCNYTITSENGTSEGMELKVNTADPRLSYTITFEAGNDTVNKTWTNNGFVSRKSLKPCRTYTLHFTPNCKPQSKNTFTTRKLRKSDLTPKVNIQKDRVQLCFETKWDLNPECIEVNHNNTFIYQTVTFDEKVCEQDPLTFQLPPDLPVIKYENKIPVSFTWFNKPQKYKGNYNFSCYTNDSPGLIEPFQNYTCNLTYEHQYGGSLNKTFPVYIACEVTNDPQLTVTDKETTLSWNLTSKNCLEINLSMDLKCFSLDGKAVGSCSESNCSDLQPYTEYKCTVMAKYNNTNFKNISKSIRTSSSTPTLDEKLTLRADGHNDLKVICKVLKWNGSPGKFHVDLYIGSKKELSKSETKCHFVFEDLYYLTNYTVKVYAFNGNNDRSGVKERHHSTKYNDKAVLGFLAFFIVVTALALLFVLFKIYILKKKSESNDRELDHFLPQTTLLRVEPINAEDLVDQYKKKRADEARLFMDEFQSIPRIFSNFSVKEAKKPENQTKNRYVDILPYDHNRVMLSNGGREDYINASFIEGYKEPNKYIAAQGPKEETVGDFWRMVWEQKSSIIVMVTRCEEGSKNKCAQYWPSLDRETEIFDDLVVKIKGEETCPDYIIRHMTLINKKEKATEREVTQIQFISWPDHGVPADPGLLLKLRRRVNSFKNMFSGPIVTHCSAGVGRTGTYICIDAMIESLEAECRVDIYGYVVKLRRQRCLMVQVEAQYILIHTALVEYNQFGETEILLRDFHSQLNTLKQKETNESSLMEIEFQKLPKFTNYRTTHNAKQEENKPKNRYSSIIPYDFNRVGIKLEEDGGNASEPDEDESSDEDEPPTKYINASYLDGYWSPNSIITTQGPMPETVADFLLMLHQKSVKAVFMLTECTENDKELCAPYWANESKMFDDIMVKIKDTETFPTYIRRRMEIQHTKRKESHTLHQYQFLKWAGHELPVNPHDLIDMMKCARENIASSSRNKNVPIVVHCNDGSSRSGIFCALWKLMDSADTEKLVDVFQVVKYLRKSRMGMISSFNQYQFLYSALEVAFPVQNGDVKKTVSPDTVQVINETTALLGNMGADHDTEIDSTEKDGKDATVEAKNEDKAEAEKEVKVKAEEEDKLDAEKEPIAAIKTEPANSSLVKEASESSSMPEKEICESASNGPTVTIES